MKRAWWWAIVLGLVLGTSGISAPTAPDGASAAPGNRRFLGYYVSYDPNSWASLEAQASMIDVVAAQWVTIDACGQIGSNDDQTLNAFARARGIQVFPSLVTFSGWLNHQILSDDAVAAQAVDQIVAYVMAEGYDGFDLDLEGVRADDRAAYTAFVTRLGAALHAQGKLLTLALPAKTADTTTGWGGAVDYAAVGAQADLVTIMAYEFSGSWGGPGPIAPYDWVERVTAFATSQMAPEKVLLGLAFYGYDWNTTSGGARALGAPQALALGERYGVAVDLDPTTRSETLRYTAPGSAALPRSPATAAPSPQITTRTPPPCAMREPGPTATPAPRPSPPPDEMQQHEVWVEGSASAAARLPLVDRYGAGGVAAWRLGLEDPSMWEVLDRWRR